MGRVQEHSLGYLGQLNQVHLKDHPGEHDLAARIASDERAARMRTAAREAPATRTLHGLDGPATRDFGTTCRWPTGTGRPRELGLNNRATLVARWPLLPPSRRAG